MEVTGVTGMSELATTLAGEHYPSGSDRPNSFTVADLGDAASLVRDESLATRPFTVR